MILDVCCGSKMFWFDKSDNRSLFVDNRLETHLIDQGTPGTVGRKPIVVCPDVKADFQSLPLKNESFSLVVFDPPHIKREKAKGIITRKYGHLKDDWRNTIRKGFTECFRVLKKDGTLIFKWAENEFPVSEILKLTDSKPLFGQKSGKRAGVHWLVFTKAV